VAAPPPAVMDRNIQVRALTSAIPWQAQLANAGRAARVAVDLAPAACSRSVEATSSRTSVSTAAAGLAGSLAGAAVHARRQRRRCHRRVPEPSLRRGLSIAMRAAGDLEEFRHFTSSCGEEFEIFPDRVLGAGAQGTVYGGRRKSSGEKVAVKVIATWRLRLEMDGMKKLHEIEQEVSTLRKLGQHANVAGMIAGIDIFRSGNPSPVPHYKFIVMEAVEGRELAEHIALGGPMGEPLVRHVFLQIVAALAHVHRAGIIHRDLKPENVLVTGNPLDLDSEVKLIDFGVAKCLTTGPLKTVVGTPLIMAPEVAKARLSGQSGSTSSDAAPQLAAVGVGHATAGAATGRHSFSWGVPAGSAPGALAVGSVTHVPPPQFSPKIDVWSAGVVLYTCLAGKVPFTSEKEIIEAEYLQSPLNRFSEEAKDLLAGMLEKQPHKRLSLDEVRQHPWIACAEDDSCTIFDFDLV